MAITEIFPNPTAKEVAFEIKFPNLFFLESKIGDLQLQIMKEFPQSSLVFQRQVVFADVGQKIKMEELPKEYDQESCKKIWQFRSDKNYHLNVSSDSLSITSNYHKTYMLEGGHKFRDIIKLVVDSFLKVTSIPTISRIGLRYIDECPIPSKDNTIFTSYYNTTFPITRFDLSSAVAMDFKAVVKRENHFIRYVEALRQLKDGGYALVLDFDGFANNIKSEDYLSVADDLHILISDEFEKTIKKPVYEYMKKLKDEKK